ncbi:TorF family putative porin [Acinetobacter baumannii]|uniref:TorF family putative porin n=1 Tax=Acinetobacter baumannii TaxID=470 RepID=UPI00338E7323
MMKFALKAVTFGVLTAGSTMVMAEDAPSFYGITATGSVAATTDYRFRGITQSSNNPAIQGGFTFSHKSGAYVALWGSSVDFNIPGVSTETDISLGYTNTLKLSDTLAPTYDVGVIRYGYIGSDSKFTNPYNGDTGFDFTEFYGKLTFADSLFKGDALSVGVNYSNDYWGHSDEFWYFNVGYSAPIADTGFTGLASVGYNKLKNKDSLLVVAGGPGEDDSYIDYKVGVNYNILGIVAELDVVGTDISTSGMTDAQKKPYDTGLVFSLTKTF